MDPGLLSGYHEERKHGWPRKSRTWSGSEWIPSEEFDEKHGRDINVKTGTFYKGTRFVRGALKKGESVVQSLNKQIDKLPFMDKVDEADAVIGEAVQPLLKGVVEGYGLLPENVRENISSGASAFTTKLEESTIGWSQQLDLHPVLTDTAFTIAEGVITAGAGPTTKLLKEGGEALLTKQAFRPAYVNGVLSQGVEVGLKNDDLIKTSFQYSDIKDVPANVRTRRAAKIHFRNTEFIDEFSAKTKQLQDHFAKHGNLDNVDASVRKITAPNGEQYVWKSTAPKGQKGVYSWKAVSNIKEVTRSRRAAQALDQDTLRPLFKKITDTEDGIDPILEYEKYQRTNKKVVQKVQDAINLANKLPDGTKKPKSEWLSLEHIFDVNFYTRTKKDLVTSFAGKGADELDNLKVIPYTLNSLTGAENKKITIGDALVKAVRRGEFTDYDKSVSQFIYNNIGDAVNKFTDKDWKNFTDRVLKGEDGVTIQDILFDITSKNNYGTNHGKTRHIKSR